MKTDYQKGYEDGEEAGLHNGMKAGMLQDMTMASWQDLVNLLPCFVTYKGLMAEVIAMKK